MKKSHCNGCHEDQIVPGYELATAMKQIKKKHHLTGMKTMENESIKPLKKMDSACALIARGWGVNFVSRCLRWACAQLHVILRRTDDWKDGRRNRHTDDTDVLLRIHHVIGLLPTYGYHRVWARLGRQNLMECLQSMPNMFTGSCARMRCCLSEKPLYRHRACLGFCVNAFSLIGQCRSLKRSSIAFHRITGF